MQVSRSRYFLFVYIIQKNVRELDAYRRFMSTQNSTSSIRASADFVIILNVGENYKGVMSPWHDVHALCNRNPQFVLKFNKRPNYIPNPCFTPYLHS